MSCVVQYNAIARKVAAEVGDVFIEDLYGYVEDFCHYFPKDNASSGYGGNYTDCAIQTTGLHFFNSESLEALLTVDGVVQAAFCKGAEARHTTFI